MKNSTVKNGKIFDMALYSLIKQVLIRLMRSEKFDYL